ncbi:MAG: hypothetical protein H7A52_18870 [Akkermansiaceae bacterium]|nr:hypothetical protein [Akkermansiaceae bacterium]
MKSVIAHYDGQRVCLDEEVTIAPETKLLVTILEDSDRDREEFLRLAGAAFADSYGDDEIEYTEADLKR